MSVETAVTFKGKQMNYTYLQFLSSLFLLLTFFTSSVHSQNNILVYRTEYEKVNSVIYDIDDPNEGSISYSIVSGNAHDYFKINSNTGKLKIKNIIPDTFGVISTEQIVVQAGNNQYQLSIVDGYDYFLSQLDTSYSVLSQHHATYVDSASYWTAMNNLWGKGTAIPGVDFRIATIHKKQLPDTTFFLWDVPGKASDFGGASVWCYVNMMWGNRKNYREDLTGFPFKLKDKEFIPFKFDFKQLFGTEEFKIAMNAFLTDEDSLVKFSENDGDFFFVFDQKGTYIPPYPYSLPDTNILGKTFAMRYDDSLNGKFYERRRVIIKNNERLMHGTVDIKSIFNHFAAAGFMNLKQSLPMMQIGLEITSGFGAVALNKYELSATSTGKPEEKEQNERLHIYPNPVSDILYLPRGVDTKKIRLYDLRGAEINVIILDNKMDLSGLAKGLYILEANGVYTKIIKQ